MVGGNVGGSGMGPGAFIPLGGVVGMFLGGTVGIVMKSGSLLAGRIKFSGFTDKNIMMNAKENNIANTIKNINRVLESNMFCVFNRKMGIMPKDTMITKSRNTKILIEKI